MRIAIDAHWLGTRMTGGETYVRNLLRGLARIDAENEYHIVTADPASLPEEVRNAGNFRCAKMSLKWAPIRIALALPGLMRRVSADLLHVNYVAPPVSPCPIVVTIYDISYEVFPEFFNARDRWALAMSVPLSARRATKIIACSESTKRDLVKSYDLSEDRIVVAYGAASEDFGILNNAGQLHRVRTEYGLEPPYVMTVGNIQPRKNLCRLIQAYSLLREQGTITHRLAIVGQAHWQASDVFRLVQEKGLQEEVIFTGYVPDEHLTLLYNGADLFVFPSLYEGFGLPVLEAMACGTPVISSNAASLPEVAGDAALLVDPYDVEGLAREMGRALSDSQLRESLAARGLRRARQFSWEETARRTLQVYEEVLAQSAQPES